MRSRYNFLNFTFPLYFEFLVHSTRPLSSVVVLASLNFRRYFPRLVSCYAFFQGWLLLSRPPRCLRMTTSFPTEYMLETLDVSLGCFPFARRT